MKFGQKRFKLVFERSLLSTKSDFGAKFEPREVEIGSKSMHEELIQTS